MPLTVREVQSTPNPNALKFVLDGADHPGAAELPPTVPRPKTIRSRHGYLK